MAGKLKFELVSPERLLMSEEVDQVTVPGTEGDFTVLAEHAPLLSTIRPGIVDVRGAQGETRIFVHGGFAEVNPEGLTVLAETAIDMADLKAEDVTQRIETAQQEVSAAATDEKRRIAQETLDHLKQLQASL